MPRPLPLPPSALLLDLDGTLVDTEGLHFESALSVLDDFGVAMAPAEFEPYIGWAEVPFWEDLVRRFALPASPAELLERRTRAFLDLLHGTSIEPLPGVADLLDWAEAHQVPVAVASSSPRAQIEASLRAAGLADRIRVRRSGHEDVAAGKPAPDVYLAAAAALGVEPKRAIAVEDSPTGLRAALAAGAFAVAVPCCSHPAPPEALEGADLVLDDLGQLAARLAASTNRAGNAAPKTSS